MAEISDKLYRNSLIFSQRDLHGVEVVPHIGVFCTTGKNMLANTATGGGVWGWWREELEAAERSFHVFLHIQELSGALFSASVTCTVWRWCPILGSSVPNLPI